MENRRAIIISAVCFVISIILITAYTRVRRSEMTSEFGEEVAVVFAKQYIGEYQVIRPSMIETRMVFKAYRQPSAPSDMGLVVGKSAYVPIYKDEQVTLTKLVTQDGKPVLDRQVEVKSRALTVKIQPHTGVGRLIRPGDHVDIITTPNYDFQGTTIFEVKTVLQNVLVLATGKHIQNEVPSRVDSKVMGYLEEEFEKRRRRDYGGGSQSQLPTSRPADEYQTLTLQLSPENAKKLLFLSHTYGDGRLYYTLRNPADQQIAQLDTTLLDDVLGPDSDYGRSFRRPPTSTPPKPRYYDSKGGRPIPVY